MELRLIPQLSRDVLVKKLTQALVKFLSIYYYILFVIFI